MLRVIFVGYGESGAGVLGGLLESGCDVLGVITWSFHEQSTQSFPIELIKPHQEDPIARLIRRYRLKKLPFTRLNNYAFVEFASSLDLDLIVVSCWGEILKPFVFTIPKIGTINCHPSLLPKYRGANPFSSVILQGEKETGITFHMINEGIDTGPILLQAKTSIGENDTGQDVKLKCSILTKQYTPVLIASIQEGHLKPIEQIESESSYFSKLQPKDGSINWNQDAYTIHNQIRGLYPWISSYTAYRNKLLLLEKSSLVHAMIPHTAPGRILNIDHGKILVGTGSPEVSVLIEKVSLFRTLQLFSNWYINNIMAVGESFYEP